MFMFTWVFTDRKSVVLVLIGRKCAQNSGAVCIFSSRAVGRATRGIVPGR